MPKDNIPEIDLTSLALDENVVSVLRNIGKDLKP
jgi:hypothetical protein